MVVKALVAIGLWGAATIGYLFTRLALWERAVAVAAAFLLVAAIPWTDQAGFILSAAFVGWHWWRSKAEAVGV